ncbi:MAG TPA: DUF2267 domain-containing protein [Longimicrobiales bacterium]|nr:DUF2267 domain-containing protein [Longimicrobiales bacterium]
MTTTHVSGLDESIHKTNVWLKELREELGVDSSQAAFTALRATLHAIRDRLSVEEAADFASQLPTVLRGVYYENWGGSSSHKGRRTGESFLADIRDAFRPGPDEPPGVTPEQAVRAVKALLDRHVSEGQLRHVRSALPDQVSEMVM